MTNEEIIQITEHVNKELLSASELNGLYLMDANYEDAPSLRVIGNIVRPDSDFDIGHLKCMVGTFNNPKSIEYAIAFLKKGFRENKHPEGQRFYLDARLLNFPEVIEFLREEHTAGTINYLNIIGRSYTLTKEDYNKVSFLRAIAAPSVAPELEEERKVASEDPDVTYAAGLNAYFQAEGACFIKQIPSDEKIVTIAREFNLLRAEPKTINIRFYNPQDTITVIEKLHKAGLDKDTKINILGYPLQENQAMYNRLAKIAKKREIEVTYTCCHDLLGNYCHEPYMIGNHHFSELEPGGTTDFKTYCKVLEFLENFEKSVENVDSNMEKTIIAYQYLNENYYYDVDSGETRSYGATRDVHQILDTDEIVCVGYANLLTIMCRRVGIPMFTYGAPSHRMNVARIVDKDEHGQIIYDKICTFDPTNDCGYYEYENGRKVRKNNSNSYTYFGISPERWLHSNLGDPSFITLANALCINPDEYNQHQFFSRSPYNSTLVGNYTPKSYMFSMLQLMGYHFAFNQNIDDVVAKLHTEGRIGEIEENFLIETIKKVERRKHNELNDADFEEYFRGIEQRIRETISLRDSRIFTNPTAEIKTESGIVAVTGFENYTPTENIDLAAIDSGPVYYRDYDLEGLNGTAGGNGGSTDPIEEEEEELTTPTETPTNNGRRRRRRVIEYDDPEQGLEEEEEQEIIATDETLGAKFRNAIKDIGNFLSIGTGKSKFLKTLSAIGIGGFALYALATHPITTILVGTTVGIIASRARKNCPNTPEGRTATRRKLNGWLRNRHNRRNRQRVEQNLTLEQIQNRIIEINQIIEANTAEIERLQNARALIASTNQNNPKIAQIDARIDNLLNQTRELSDEVADLLLNNDLEHTEGGPRR